MTNKQILELAEFFYSSNDSNVVPLRLAITTGQYSGSDLDMDNFITLMKILSNSNNLKKDLLLFRERIEDEE